MQIKPVIFMWDGEAMQPEHRFAPLCDRQYVVGERYTLIPHEERSDASHRQYFAEVNEVWKNLPDELAQRFPTPEHLRKWCLIRCGYADSRSVVCASDTEAERIAAFLRPMDAYAVIVPNGPVVTVYTAQSQAKAAMNKQKFQQSKHDVLEFLAELIRINRETLAQEAAKAAPHHASERLRNPVEEVV